MSLNLEAVKARAEVWDSTMNDVNDLVAEVERLRDELAIADRDRAQREDLRKAEVKRLREQLDFSDSIRAQRDELREKNRQANALIKELRTELASIRAMGVLTPDDPSLPPDIDAELAQHAARDVEVSQSCPAIHPRDRQRCYDVAGHQGRHHYDCAYDEPYDVYWDAAESTTDPQPTPAAGTPLPIPPGSRKQMPATAIWGRNALEVWPEAGES